MKGVHCLRNSLCEEAILDLVRASVNSKRGSKPPKRKLIGKRPQRYYHHLLKGLDHIESHVAFGDCQFKFRSVIVATEHEGGLTISIPSSANDDFKHLLYDFELMPYIAKSRSQSSRLISNTSRYWSGNVSDEVAKTLVKQIVSYYIKNPQIIDNVCDSQRWFQFS